MERCVSVPAVPWLYWQGTAVRLAKSDGGESTGKVDSRYWKGTVRLGMSSMSSEGEEHRHEGGKRTGAKTIGGGAQRVGYRWTPSNCHKFDLTSYNKYTSGAVNTCRGPHVLTPSMHVICA